VRHAAERQARTTDDFDEIWCVTDVDQYDLEPAVRLAKAKGISLAVSNPHGYLTPDPVVDHLCDGVVGGRPGLRGHPIVQKIDGDFSFDVVSLQDPKGATVPSPETRPAHGPRHLHVRALRGHENLPES
jgi:hypothetical protein